MQVALAAVEGEQIQAHLTAELNRHAGMPPSRLRGLGQRQVRHDVVRFFKDLDIRQRVQLLLAPNAAREEGRDGLIQAEGSPVSGTRGSEL